MNRICWLVLLFAVFAGSFPAHAQNLPAPLARLLGPGDSLLVTGPDGKAVFSHNPDTPRIPASTLKIFTSLFALETLGPGYRFPTAFYLRGDDTLVMKGFGDPLLVSEVLEAYAGVMAQKAPQARHLVLDHFFFEHPVVIPGTGSSANPYDSPVGALSANFNTVYFARDASGRLVSAETQTPLLDFAQKIIRQKKLPPGRVLLTHVHDQATLYCGHLFSHFRQAQNGRGFESISIGRVREGDRLIWTAESPHALDEVCKKMLEFSNNFITNQVFLAAGAGQNPPANLLKSVAAAKSFAAGSLDMPDMKLAEGSGISRSNAITARQMDKILRRFAPFAGLLQEADGVRYKTGTLSGISTRAGFIRAGEKDFAFTVFCNTPGVSAQKVTAQAVRLLREMEASPGRK
jgi:D-alanyl-D-alanine carboxypeptidase/D-alanyl-D-alanine-endopeptidase (penicillin-binding protein 4)